jgi:HIV Tat-specific factor 1
MKIQPADFSYKAQQDAPPKTNMRDKKKIIARTARLNRCVVARGRLLVTY